MKPQATPSPRSERWRRKPTLNAVFLFVLVVGAVMAVVLTVILTSRRNKSSESDLRVMYFSMYLGDGRYPVSRHLRHAGFFARKSSKATCSFQENINNTHDSIMHMLDVKQLYGFIFYADDAKVTSPKKALDALKDLENVVPVSNGMCNQSAAINEFAERAKGRPKDILVHYIPCNFSYGVNNSDTKSFVAAIREHGMEKKITLVSNTEKTDIVAATFNHTKENVIGKDENTVRKIEDIETALKDLRLENENDQ